MKITPTLKILGREFEVIQEVRNKDHGVDHAGACSPYYHKLYIANTEPQEGMELTLLHEIIEIIVRDFELKIISAFGEGHKSISTISNVLYQVLKDNDLMR